MIDLSIISVYFLILLYVGWGGRRQSAESFWLAERKNATKRITMSLVATVFGATSTMGIIGLAYSRGLTAAWWTLIGGLSMIPLGLFFASRVRSLNAYTLPDLLAGAFGEKTSVPASIMIATAWCGVIAAQLIAAGRLVGGLFSINFELSLFIVALVFTVYTFWGGQLSVIRTDVWQLAFFVGGLFISLLFLLPFHNTTLHLWANIPHSHWEFPVSDIFGWYELLVFYPLIIGLPYLVGPDMYSRILCSKDDRVARKSTLLAAIIVIPLSFLLAVFGVLARAHFPDIPPEAALPKTLICLIPTGLRGLIIAGFLSAIMSSADTCLISASTILTLNVVRPFYNMAQQRQLQVTRAIVLLLGIAAWFIAGRQQGIISSLLLGYKVFVGGVVIPTLATFFQKSLKISSAGALWAIIIGGGTAILGNLQGGLPLKTILTPHGQAFLKLALGSQYLSILPIVLSILVVMGSFYLSPRASL